MRTFSCILFILTFFVCSGIKAQQGDAAALKKGHTNTNKFKQLYDEFSSPNVYRAASGAPGHAYYQQRADYKMDIVLDDKNAKLYGEETITYTNNAPDVLHYLWVQLDQNVRTKNTKTSLIEKESLSPAMLPKDFTMKYLKTPFDGGFNIEYVKTVEGEALDYTVNQTMMRVELPKPMETGDKFSFSIKWWYNINDHVINRDRSGYEFFPKDGNRAYVIAQFYPRMAVYSDVEGWQNSQFWGKDEFALPFGDFEVNITVPADHILEGTGVITNRKDVYTPTMLQRYEKAKQSFDKPVVIVTEEEAKAAEKNFATTTKTWKLKAENVRDFGFATSRKFILDMMAVKIGGASKMAVSLYPKEGNPLWEDWSTRAVASTLKTYSRMTFDYPYHKAVSVHAKNQGMEYPMICWNYGRPGGDGTFNDRVKYGMMGVIIHEVGHNFFPMIVNSDERQWTWMDEGLNTFVQYLAEQEFGKTYPEALSKADENFPSDRGPARMIVPYMSGNQDYIAPIMTKGSNTYQFGNNAYGKPATGLNILRETIMGHELFDYAFKTYAQRWMFKHPTPEDFFRTMEDASAVDLDWFWRGWFYTTDWVDIGIKEVKQYFVSSDINAFMRKYLKDNNLKKSQLKPIVYLIDKDSDDYKPSRKKESLDDIKALKNYLIDNFSEEERQNMKAPRFFYNITFEKPGGLVMPIIVEFTYDDGSKENVTYPAEIWRLNDKSVTKVLAREKAIVKIQIDPELKTADVDVTNNTWPKTTSKSEFDTFKESQQK